jgi:hypothetical protein
MRQNIYLITGLLFLSLVSYSQKQDITRKDLGDIELRIRNFLSEQDYAYSEGRKSEFAQLILETDSNGVIKEIRLAGKDTDSLYKMLKKMTSSYFNGWKGPKNKNIIIPYFYLSAYYRLPANYVDAIFTVSESGNTIMYKWFCYYTPQKPDPKY